MQADNQEIAKIEPVFRPVFSFPHGPNLSHPKGDLRCATWPELAHAIRELITQELAALVLVLHSINGVFTEDSYRERCDELFSQSVRDTRAAALTEAARKAVKKLSGMRDSVTVTRSQVTVGPNLTEFSNLGVGIDLSICKWGTKNSVFKGTFTGDQEYSFERRSLEHTERNPGDGDQPMGTNEHRSDMFSTGTGSSRVPGSDLASKQTVRDQSFSGKSIGFSGDNFGVSGDSTSVSAQITEKGNQSVSIFG